MIALVYAIVFISAIVGSGIALRIATSTTEIRRVQFATALSAATAVLWLLVTAGSFNVVVYSGGSEFSNSYPSLGVVGVLGVAISVIVLAKGSIELLNG